MQIAWAHAGNELLVSGLPPFLRGGLATDKSPAVSKYRGKKKAFYFVSFLPFPRTLAAVTVR